MPSTPRPILAASDFVGVESVNGNVKTVVTSVGGNPNAPFNTTVPLLNLRDLTTGANTTFSHIGDGIVTPDGSIATIIKATLAVWTDASLRGTIFARVPTDGSILMYDSALSSDGQCELVYIWGGTGQLIPCCRRGTCTGVCVLVTDNGVVCCDCV